MQAIGVTPNCTRCEEMAGGVGTRGNGKKKYQTSLFLHIPRFCLTLEKPRLTGFCFDSMICEKQFVPFDDQSLYCSEE